MSAGGSSNSGTLENTLLRTAGLNRVHEEPGGQVTLLQTEEHYLGFLAARFGSAFTEYRRRWRETSEGGDPGDFPLSLDLAVNGGCQLACRMCPLAGRDRRYRPMDRSLYRRLMSQAREHRLPALTLGLAGEPLLNPEAADLAAEAFRAGIMDIRLGTNGQLLTENLSRRLIDSGLTRLEISLDAVEPATYQAIRGGRGLIALERRIEKFLELRAKSGSPLPLLRLSFLCLPENEGELEPFLVRWSGRVDLFSVQRPIWFPDSRLPRPAGRDEADTAICVQPRQRLGIHYDGEFWPCCSWYGQGLLLERADRIDIARLWRGPVLTALREALVAGGVSRPSACQDCLKYQ